MHHARRSYGAGFCIYNDVALCARNLIQKYNLERILILDTDAHAGDGTCEIFYEDPRVLFMDLHQDPHTLYPGTGFAHEIGADNGKGYTANVPMLTLCSRIYPKLIPSFSIFSWALSQKSSAF